MKILLLDNYDSFTYNLVHYIEAVCDEKVAVFRNDEISLDEIEQYDKIMLSPGAGLPKNAGIMPQLINRYASSKSILGVCLGHQAIAEAFGCSLLNLNKVFHGVSTPIKIIKEDKLFHKLPETFKVGRYHSWVVDAISNDSPLEITAVDEAGSCMALRHKTLDIRGVQFHPESILSEHGFELISNWIHL